MAIEALLVFLFSILTALTDLVPDITLPSFDFSGIVGLMQALNTGLPVTELLAVVAAWLAIIGALFGFQLARNVIRHIPWIGGG